jgi:MIP family channel proteins
MNPTTGSKSLAEFMGTFAIVFFGGGSVCVSTMPGVGLGLIGIALTFGIIVAVMVSATGHISGAHFNPAVTFMALATKRIGPQLALVYVAAQMAGATVAALALGQVIGPEYWSKVNLSATALATGVTPLSGLLIEVILTFFLVLVIFGTAIDAKGHKLGGIAIGGVVMVDILMAGPLTGASMNPARSFGPALVSGFWQNHWVYWVGPLAGAVAAALLYDRVFAARPVTAAKSAEAATAGAMATPTT